MLKLAPRRPPLYLPIQRATRVITGLRAEEQREGASILRRVGHWGLQTKLLWQRCSRLWKLVSIFQHLPSRLVHAFLEMYNHIWQCATKSRHSFIHPSILAIIRPDNLSAYSGCMSSRQSASSHLTRSRCWSWWRRTWLNTALKSIISILDLKGYTSNKQWNTACRLNCSSPAERRGSQSGRRRRSRTGRSCE